MDKACKSNDLARDSGRRVNNALVIYPWDRDNLPKGGLIPNDISTPHGVEIKGGSQGLPPEDEPASYQLVGGGTAHQGD